jgi:hypothetical protein
VRLAALAAAAARLGAEGVPPDSWPIPGAVRDLARLCCEQPPPRDGADAIVTWLERVDAWRRAERFDRALAAWEAVDPGQHDELERLRRARDAARGARPAPGASDPRAAVHAVRVQRVHSALCDTGESS